MLRAREKVEGEVKKSKVRVKMSRVKCRLLNVEGNMSKVKCRILHVEGEKITKKYYILRSGNRFG
jgi:ribosomal protein S28E/S33